MKQTMLSMAKGIIFAIALTITMLGGASAQQLLSASTESDAPRIHLKGTVDRGIVRVMPGKSTGQKGRCQPHLCCNITMNRQCDPGRGICVYASWNGHGCGTKYNEAGDNLGCCDVITV